MVYAYVHTELPINLVCHYSGTDITNYTSNINESRNYEDMIFSIWMCQIRELNHGTLEVYFIPPLYILQMSTNVLQMEDWVHVLRYVPILQDHSSVVVILGILYRDMPALVRNAFMGLKVSCNLHVNSLC